VKVALVGCGTAAEYYHLPALVSEIGARNLWFVDADLARARRLAAAAGAHAARAVTDVPADDVDAAIVAVPSHLHAGVAAPLLESGVHVLCEKPMATTSADARRVLEAARTGGSVLAVGHFRRFFPTTPLVADLLARGVCGTPRRFAAEEGYVFAWEAQSDYWLDASRAGGGVLADLGPHVLDLVRTWLGEEVAVVAYRDDALGGVEADCVLELIAPVPGTIELSRTRPLRNEIRIECEAGVIVAPLSQPGEVTLELGERTHRLRAEGNDGYPEAFRAQLANFLAAATSGGAPAVSGADGVAVIDAIESAYSRREPLDQPWVTERESA
jgi:predicted dehydrogenase